MDNSSKQESELTQNELVLETKNTPTPKKRGRPAKKRVPTSEKIEETVETNTSNTEDVKTDSVPVQAKLDLTIDSVTVPEEVETEKVIATEEVKKEKKIITETVEKKITKEVIKENKMAEIKNEEVLSDESVADKREALKDAKVKFKEAVALSVEEELAKVENVEIISSQFTKSSDFVQNMLTKLMNHLEIAEIQGRRKVEDAVDGLLGDNIANDVVTTTLGYVGGKVAKGYTMGTAPAVVVSGAVKGAYKKIVD